MKRSGHQPRLLTAVMEAIANLKDGKGSTQKRIIDQVQNLLSSKNVSLRNVTVHVRKALKHGVESGLIKQKGGKFKLGLDSKDYAIFKNFQKMEKDGELPLTEHRRRGRRGRRGRGRRSRRKRRRRSLETSSPDDYVSESGSACSDSHTPEPADKGRRRRRRRRRGRRGRRRTEECDSSSSASTDTKEISPKASDENPKNSKKNERDSKERSDEDEEHHDVDDPDCGNPQCLCNLKQEMSDMQYRSSAHDTYRDPYAKQ